MRALYSLAISLYAAAVRFAAPLDAKAAQLAAGWRHWRHTTPFDRLDNAKVAWFHAASLGEFEQARPIIEEFHRTHPDYKIALTFFSPSGYEIRKDYSLADIVCYLPPDTRRNARDLVRLLHPDIAFFVKYDFWFNILRELDRRHTATYLFSALFRPQQYFFRWYGRWFARQLQAYSHLFVQNDESVALLRSVGVDQCSIAGDTRFDRVSDIAANAAAIPVVEHFADGTPVLMAGSSWEPDEQRISLFLKDYDKPLKVVLAPHVISNAHLDAIENLFGKENCVRYSQLADAYTKNNASNDTDTISDAASDGAKTGVIADADAGNTSETNSVNADAGTANAVSVSANASVSDTANASVSDTASADSPQRLFDRQTLIIDNIGMLSALYRYATVAVIGGGFGKGIHNTLEAAAFGCPVCFGPNYKKFKEACGLIDNGAARTFSSADDLAGILSLWLDSDEARQKASAACMDFMRQNLGATKTIMDCIDLS